MSDEKQPETDADYLTRRGWVIADPEWIAMNPTLRAIWADPNFAVGEHEGVAAGWWTIGDALTIQSARDEQEARAAWVQFRALASSAGSSRAADADGALTEYRARFSRRVAP